MLRVFAIAATFALALPTLAAAQGGPPEHERGREGPGRPVGRPAVVPHGGPPHAGPPPHVTVHPGPVHPEVVGPGVGRREIGPGPGHGPGPVPVVGHGPILFHGHELHPVHFARPWVYPPGWGYRRWAIGAVVPALFLVPAYYYTEWAALGLTPPPPGYQWVQYGPDLLLVNVTNGQVIDAAYGVFY
jgi:hypothetical protein